MPVVFDNSFLALLYGPFQTAPIDPRTRKPVDRAQERIEALVDKLSKAQVRILIPTPALCEFLTLAGRAGSSYLDIIDSTSRFQVVPFDQASAVEAARLLDSGKRSGDKRRGRKQATWQKVKFDHQIVAIAVTQQASEIYSNDEDIASFGAQSGVTVFSVAELASAPPRQTNLPLTVGDG